MGIFDIFRKKTISSEWQKVGLTSQQEVLDTINEAFNNKEKIASNIYIGKAEKTNVCLVLDEKEKIENAFPVKTDKNIYDSVVLKLKEYKLNEAIDEIQFEILSIFLITDLLNDKENILDCNEDNFDSKKRNYKLFNIFFEKKSELAVVITDIGAFAVDKKIIFNVLRYIK